MCIATASRAIKMMMLCEKTKNGRETFFFNNFFDIFSFHVFSFHCKNRSETIQ